MATVFAGQATCDSCDRVMANGLPHDRIARTRSQAINRLELSLGHIKPLMPSEPSFLLTRSSFFIHVIRQVAETARCLALSVEMTDATILAEVFTE
jgi:hypothetical protein